MQHNETATKGVLPSYHPLNDALTGSIGRQLPGGWLASEFSAMCVKRPEK